jgi:hypothetical protein
VLLLTLGVGFAFAFSVGGGIVLRFGKSDGAMAGFPFPLVAAGTITAAGSLIFGNSLNIKQKSPIR